MKLNTVKILLLTLAFIISSINVLGTHTIKKKQPKSMYIKIMIPKNKKDYQNYKYCIQKNNCNNIKTTIIEKKLLVPYNKNFEYTTIDYAIQQLIKVRGGLKPEIIYFKVKDNQIYMALDIEVDGYAGVSILINDIYSFIKETVKILPNIQGFGKEKREIAQKNKVINICYSAYITGKLSGEIAHYCQNNNFLPSKKLPSPHKTR